MRMGRLVALILAVERRGGATAHELAEELEVSVRTIYRYVSALQAAGVPVWTETGPGGGIRLVDGWRAPVDGFTAPEATALLVGTAAAAVVPSQADRGEAVVSETRSPTVVPVARLQSSRSIL
jgi:predicted DNA-binding transcriptional regulator YafY